MKKIFIAAAAATAMISTTAWAYDLDITTGEGFVGKGEVQSALGLNNHGLQAGAGEFVFTIEVENEWTCSKPHPVHDYDITQERNNETYALLFSVERTRNQINGFLLTGFDGSPQTSGPATGSCPADQSGFVEGSLTTTGGGLMVNGVAL